MFVPVLVVDAFTPRPFAGNPAAVCITNGPVDEAWMVCIAREMNLSETAFLHPEAEAWRLRWRTPTVEVDLCGHATLASAHALWETGRLAPDAPARFLSRSGPLGATRDGDRIVLDFPAMPCAPMDPPAGLLDALGVTARFVGRTRDDLLVEVADEATVRGAAPDFRALRTLGTRGVMVTAPAASPDYHFVSRFFAPGSGIDEDPVTGSAHCALGPYWGARLGLATMRAWQASARGGEIGIDLRGERVALSGQAVTVARAEILGPG